MGGVSALVKYDLELGGVVCGADEAGRGCLAGPIVAAAVRLDYRSLGASAIGELSRLNDSKKLTPRTREQLFGRVLAHAQAVAVVTRSAGWIDQQGLHRTNLEILATATDRVAGAGCVALTDGFAVRDARNESRPVVKGDATSAAIAAASIVAKVSRDRMMEIANDRFPGYGFATHVGYSTTAHRAAIVNLGLSEIHRRSFASTAYQQLELVA